MRDGDFDVIFVGGGLASSLGALALAARDPSARTAIVERDARLGGNHTWCFHAADVPDEARAWIEPLVVARWPGYHVHFPGRTRRLGSPYACIDSARLHAVVSERLATMPGSALFLESEARTVDAHQVALGDGRTLRATLVVRATGPGTDGGARDRGFQKFVGLELAVAPGHPFSEPVVFDARIAQRDGFRFMYVLPLAPDRLLVEETFFSDTPALDEAASRDAVLAYAAEHGVRVREVVRSERGVLPMPWADADFDPAARPLVAGYEAGLFHPVTGYSLPQAVRFAIALAESDLGRRTPSPLVALARRQRAQRPFLRLLTRMLFTCFAPERRVSVLEHFHRLPEPLIARFYAAELGPLDRARIVLGRPPDGFSLGRALGLTTGGSP